MIFSVCINPNGDIYKSLVTLWSSVNWCCWLICFIHEQYITHLRSATARTCFVPRTHKFRWPKFQCCIQARMCGTACHRTYD